MRRVSPPHARTHTHNNTPHTRVTATYQPSTYPLASVFTHATTTIALREYVIVLSPLLFTYLSLCLSLPTPNPVWLGTAGSGFTFCSATMGK